METDNKNADAPNVVRREIQARNTSWAQGFARRLAGWGIKPNWISLASVAFAAGAGFCLFLSSGFGVWSQAGLFLLAALCIQARLLCNLFDGMVAVEGGLGTPSGEIFNDLPDRLADPLILVPVGYAAVEFAGAPALGWMAGLLAVLTAYVRVLGGACGVKQSFIGPMAKQHRMALITAALIVAAAVTPFAWQDYVLVAALGLVVLGCLVTLVRRTRHIVSTLEARERA
ncbi:hypothetical protein CAI21_20680 [Alkalilimnicola ehrlichii]|uniref:CDP-alcohol phosphatidyltransferase n=1 Tax=Alkalilimnicola ehrlichii TaxID=351052 RepID=A0A3E0WFT1_9GAMM|nr:CDP-alcohol phosphatidyltransferase family protein [Alkalilimnicola ehrlichii]RFA24705.1 hypothetical protein CAI21_20680 [Alkalilimnicola ehrlichii]RFA31804.1 hypothetical protein CAL65_21450 [Alkalilimnicola ehrlichii]